MACVWVSLCLICAGSSQMPEEDIRFPGGTIIGTFEQPDVGAKNQIQALCENIICSYTLSHLPSP